MEIDTLLLAIVQREDADVATSALNQAGFAVTRISSIGGFLETGNVTLLAGLASSEVERAIAVLSKECQQRTVFVNAAAHVGEAHAASFLAPIEAQVGGATVFGLSVQRTIRLGAKKEDVAPPTPTGKGNSSMKLILAIVPQEQSNDIVDTLMAAQYRATLISTTGGFLRRGNATLLIGTGAERLDDVLKRIQDVCAASPPRAIPDESCATIFVLDVERYERV